MDEALCKRRQSAIARWDQWCSSVKWGKGTVCTAHPCHCGPDPLHMVHSCWQDFHSGSCTSCNWYLDPREYYADIACSWKRDQDVDWHKRTSDATCQRRIADRIHTEAQDISLRANCLVEPRLQCNVDVVCQRKCCGMYTEKPCCSCKCIQQRLGRCLWCTALSRCRDKACTVFRPAYAHMFRCNLRNCPWDSRRDFCTWYSCSMDPTADSTDTVCN